MQLKIVPSASEETPTQLVTETGEVVENVLRINYSPAPGVPGKVMATVTFKMIECVEDIPSEPESISETPPAEAPPVEASPSGIDPSEPTGEPMNEAASETKWTGRKRRGRGSQVD